jgi:hypothetical protein
MSDGTRQAVIGRQKKKGAGALVPSPTSLNKYAFILTNAQVRADLMQDVAWQMLRARCSSEARLVLVGKEASCEDL